MTMRRRDLLRFGGLTLVGTRVFGSIAFAQARTDRILVCLFLRGGADGLSMLVPFRDPEYLRLRPDIAIAAPSRRGDQSGKAIRLDNRFGLHPALARLQPLWRARELAAVVGLGSPHPTRSHFEQQYYFEVGATEVLSPHVGWLNRCVAELDAPSAEVSAVSLGSVLPDALRGPAPAYALGPQNMRALRQVRRHPELARALGALYEGDSSLQRSGTHALEVLDRVGRLRLRGSTSYPGGPLARRFEMVASLIRADIGLRVAFIDDGGWDTHRGQGASQGQLARKLDALAQALSTFRRDMGDTMEKVVVVCFTEFGRTIAQNGTGGTDHGRGSVALLLGPAVRGGRVYGRWQGLAAEHLADGRDLAVTTDYRDLFGEVASGVLGTRALSAVFPGREGIAERALGLMHRGVRRT